MHLPLQSRLKAFCGSVAEEQYVECLTKWPSITDGASTRETCLRGVCEQQRQSKTPILSRNVDKKSIETVFSIVICRHTGDKWQSKTLFLSIFDPRSSIVESVFDSRLPGVHF